MALKVAPKTRSLSIIERLQQVNVTLAKQSEALAEVNTRYSNLISELKTQLANLEAKVG
jgi:hypothetical protein